MTNVVEAIKKIYPDIQGGFVYWETQQDLTSWDNPIDGLLWENTEYSKPTWAQIEAQFDSVDLEAAKNNKCVSRKQYLIDTDWYVTRELDEPSTYPTAIKDKRILARVEINAIQALSTMAEVEAYSDTF